MANETVQSAKIPENPLLAKLVAAGASNVMPLQGYVGPSTRETHITLYPNLNDLSESFEIAKTDILHFAETPETVLPYGGMVVWVKKDAQIISRRSESVGNLKGAEARSNFTEINRGRLRIKIPSGGGTNLPPICRSTCRSCQSSCRSCRSTCASCQSRCR